VPPLERGRHRHRREEFQAAWCEGGIVARAALSSPGGPCPLRFLLDASTV
jgi:hypothetical protein